MGFTLKPLISSIHDACCAPNIPLIAHFIPATSVGLLSDFSGKPLSLLRTSGRRCSEVTCFRFHKRGRREYQSRVCLALIFS